MLNQREVAYHEAGHAVMHVLAKVAFGQTVLTETGGFVKNVIRKDHRLRLTVQEAYSSRAFDNYLRILAVVLAGPAAETIYRGDNVLNLWTHPDDDASDGLKGDGSNVVKIVEHIRENVAYNTHGDLMLTHLDGVPSSEDVVMRVLSMVLPLLHQHWPAVETVAESLLDHGSLSNRKVRELFKAVPTRQQPDLKGQGINIVWATNDPDLYGDVAPYDWNGETA